ncbi:hypothetical protein BLA60_40560 [Actinophytocola xinjiangensis]|uniref:Uncharacterized protein n=1 Tax=Actinophytocola xinjiangensis TaxID=485602 RepID=A0A7Z0WEB0_9PSEU|nr:hypothetical protein [Actinophytocola xinjiangensis]OLF04481.1 hypothetical protein BLA60_40560 [Actinophytocola xinjiangensis]
MPRPTLGALRWVLLAVAAALLVVYVVAQGQSADISYARSPSEGATVQEGSAGELSGADLPSVEEMTAMLERERVVRLPGAIAGFDEQRLAEDLREPVDGQPVRILIAPPGLDEEQREQIREVENATVRVVGTQVTGGIYEVTSDDLAGWQAQFTTGDVTSQIRALLAGLRDQEPPEDVDEITWREPTEAELATVADDLRAHRLHAAPGATLDELPRIAGEDALADALFAVFPQQPIGEPVPEYGPALARLFPDTQLYVMYGNWVGYFGPHADEFAEVVNASFYGQSASRLSRFAYPQGNVLHAYLGRVLDVRYAGLFDRPLPYQPFDPLRVALPALPWLFAVCVVGFLVLSTRSLFAGARGRSVRPPARLAGLTTLAIELSALSRDPALVRAIGKLGAAREALVGELPDRHVGKLLAEAEAELDTAARALGRPDYRPATYLAGGVS